MRQQHWQCVLTRSLKSIPAAQSYTEELALSEHRQTCFTKLASRYLCAITEGRVCEGLCVSWTKLWETNTVRTNTSDVKRAAYVEAAPQLGCRVFFFLFFLFQITNCVKLDIDDVFDSCGKKRRDGRSAAWLAITERRSSLNCLWSKMLFKEGKEKKQPLLCFWTSQTRKDWQSQTSLFLSLNQVTYCIIDYSTNFPLLCCLYCMW